MEHIRLLELLYPLMNSYKDPASLKESGQCINSGNKEIIDEFVIIERQSEKLSEIRFPIKTYFSMMGKPIAQINMQIFSVSC